MKPFFVAFAMLCLLTTTTASFSANYADADPEVLIQVKPLEGKTFKLLLSNLQQQTTKIKIEDLDGEVYFEAFVSKHNGYARKINLEELERGRYVLTVKQDGTNYSQVMVVKDDTIHFSKVTQH